MRELLFKGTDNDGNIVSGYYVKCRGRHYILQQWDDNGYDDRWETSDWVEVDPKTVIEYSGFDDKENDEMIFEGDKVKVYGVHGGWEHDIKEGAIGTVIFDVGTFSIKFDENTLPCMYNFQKFELVE